jgi:hypothetical protein
LYEGEPEAALRLIEAVGQRYDGRKQNPWNHIECGDHYVRALSAWALLEAALGYRYDAGAGCLAFAPVLTPERCRGPFFAAAGWGTYAQTLTATGLRASLSLARGTLTLRGLRLRAPANVTGASATAGGQPLKFEWRDVGAEVELRFEPGLVLGPAELLEITIE